MHNKLTKQFCRLFLGFFLLATLVQPATAAMISTSQLLGHVESSSGVTLDREALQQKVTEVLTQYGVTPASAAERAASLSDQELRLIQQKIDSLPAGQGALEVIGIVFLVLLILELVGVTNVFNRL